MPAAVAKAAQYARVDQLLAERNSQRSIVRATAVARMAVAKRGRKVHVASPPLPRLCPQKAQQRRWRALDLDELWTFVGRTARRRCFPFAQLTQPFRYD